MNIASTVNSALIAYAAQLAQQHAAQTEVANDSHAEAEPVEIDYRVAMLERIRASEQMELVAHYGGQFA